MSRLDPAWGRPSGWSLAVVATLLSAFVSLGFSMAGILAPGLVLAGATLHGVGPFAGYAATRSVAIAAAAVLVVVRRSPVGLLTVGWTIGAVQGLDAIVGLLGHDAGKTVGPLVLAVFNGWAMVVLGRGIAASERQDALHSS